MSRLEAIAVRAADWFAHPLVIIAVPIASAVGLATVGSTVTLTVLSVLALTFGQLILLAQNADTRDIKAAVQALVKVNPELPDEVKP